MTSLVGIRCRDGVVIAADSSATFGSSIPTMEQETCKKIEIVGNSNRIIVAGTGYVGHHQRFVEAIRQSHAKGEFKGKSELEIAKRLASAGLAEFAPTHLNTGRNLDLLYSALVAYPHGNGICLCELDGKIGLNPEVKQVDDLWFTSIGSGQTITDPFLALFRNIFWESGPPNLNGGIFTAYWALKHACDINPGGINYPIRIAVTAKKGPSFDSWMLNDNDLEETRDLVDDATRHFSGFKDIVLGNTPTSVPPVATVGPLPQKP